ncbi:MAG: sulfotransferase [Lentimonas sp.]
MLHLLFQSLLKHLKWWLLSFFPKHLGQAPLGLKRLCFLVLIYPLFLLLQSIHWVGFLCDEIFFRGYRKLAIKDPVFITGIPRSGTTFLHRTLAHDREQFTTVSTWEAFLAPSVTERVLLANIRKLDTVVGNPIKRLINYCIRKCEGDFSDVHEIGLSVPEEDYLFLLPVGGCFIMSLAFPFAKELRELMMFDQLKGKARKPMLAFYQSCLRKHLYFHGANKRLLSKNAAFSSWLKPLKQQFPDAVFMICVREPETALSSQISSLHSARDLFGTDPKGTHTTDQFTGAFSYNYRSIEKFASQPKISNCSVIIQSDLKTAPRETIRTALKMVTITPSEKLAAKLRELEVQNSSKHQHSPLENKAVLDCMRPAYNTLLKSPLRALHST